VIDGSHGNEFRFHKNVPQVAREMLTKFLRIASSAAPDEQPRWQRLREDEHRRLLALADSEFAGSAWKRLAEVSDDKLPTFAFRTCFYATNGAFAAIAKRGIPVHELAAKGLRHSRRLSRHARSARADAGSDERAVWVFEARCLHEALGLASDLLFQATNYVQSSPLLDLSWPIWQADPSLNIARANEIAWVLGNYIAMVQQQHYDQLIAPVPHVQYPLRHDAPKRIYSLALGHAAKELFGSPCDEAVTDFVTAAFGGDSSLETTRKRRQRSKQSE
jgi:hypothetical protein